MAFSQASYEQLIKNMNIPNSNCDSESESSYGETGNKVTFPFYYELSLFTANPELKAKYVLAAQKVNTLFDDASINESDKYYDAGFDLLVPPTDPKLSVNPGNTLKVDHEVFCAMILYNAEFCTVQNVSYYLYLRSSTATKTPLRLANSVGIIDAGYRGPIVAVLDHLGLNSCNEPFVTEPFQRLVQLCPPNLSYPMCIRVVDTFEDLGGPTVRGAGGFGSTGQ